MTACFKFRAVSFYNVDRKILFRKTSFDTYIVEKKMHAVFYVVTPVANTVTDTFNSINVCGKSKTEQSKPIQPIILLRGR